MPGDYGFQGDQSRLMQTRRLWIHEREGQPIPTNDWWTNLITQPYSGRMWSYPQFVQAQNYGVDVQAPSYWISDGTEMKSNTTVSVRGENFYPESAVAEECTTGTCSSRCATAINACIPPWPTAFRSHGLKRRESILPSRYHARIRLRRNSSPLTPG